MSAMLMLQNPGMWLGVVPLAVLSLYHASAFYNANFGSHPVWQRYGVRLHRWLAANKVGSRLLSRLIGRCSNWHCFPMGRVAQARG